MYLYHYCDIVSDKRSFEKSFIVIYKMILCMILCKNQMLNPFKNHCVILLDFTVDFSVEIICTIRL